MLKLISFGCIALILSLIFTPLVRKFAIRIKAISIPKDKRRVHKKPIPLLGGLSMYFSFTITFIVIKYIFYKGVPFGNTGLLIGCTIIMIGGVLDDIYDIKPWQKLCFQVIGAICLIISGISINILTNPIGDNPYLDISIVSIPLTIIWIVGVTNAFNLIDGLDGLAAGVSFISAVSIFIVAILNNRIDAAVLLIILCGAILGFLPYNFNPASIFMGDTGSQMLGFLLAAISIKGAVKSAAALSIVVPIIALGIPIYDTLFAMIRRKINGKPITQADRGHLHHRLLDMGLSQKQAVLIIYAISAVLGAISILAMNLDNKSSYVIFIIVIAALVFLGWKFGFFRHTEKKNNNDSQGEN